MSKKGLFKILVVDDEEQILDSLRRLFRSNDFEIICETNPIEAIEILSITRFDVIICDMRMPQMSGADFLVRAKKIRPAAERILLTGYADLDSTIKSINDAQIYAFVTKPWDPNQ
ncbi:response regulator, partial [Oleiphilus sp. HI0066]